MVSRSWTLRYAVAVGSVLLAVGVRLLMEPLVGDAFPFALFFLAVLVTAWVGGTRPALLALVLGIVAADFFFIPPRFAWGAYDADTAVRLTAFTAAVLIVLRYLNLLRAARDRVEAVAAELRQRKERLDAEVALRDRAEQHLARSLEREQRRASLMRALADASVTIYAATSRQAVLEAVTREARNLVGARMAMASLVEDGDWERALHSVALADEYARWRDYTAHPDGSGIYSLVCERNQPMRLTQAELEAHPAFQHFGAESDRHPPLRGWLAAPFVGRDGHNLGLVQLSDRADGDFTADDEAIVMQLANLASVALANAALYDQLREVDRRKDDFIALLAHELRNPLAPLRNQLEILRMAGGDPARVAEARAAMGRQIAILVRLIDDLLDVSRINRGLVELRRGPVGLAEVILTAVDTSRPLIDAAGHDLVLSLPDEPLFLDADATRLAQALGNLLNNAAKYTPNGGRIELTAWRDGDDAVVRIADNGMGIPKGMLDKIFEPFTQVGAALDRPQGGLGIGLSLVRRLVQMHGGSVAASSPGPGGGSKFLVRLPLGRREEAEAIREEGSKTGLPAPSPPTSSLLPPPSSLLPLRVVVVDDNVDAANSLGTLLRMLGHEVHLAYDGPAALAVVRQKRPQLVLLDIGLPGMNGYEVAERLRQDPAVNGVRLVALTGWGQEEDRRRSRAAGFDEHLVKPVDPSDLNRVLAETARVKGRT